MPTHEAHSVASEKELAYPRIPGEVYPNSHLCAPSSSLVATGGECPGTGLAPLTAQPSNIYRRLKRRCGHSQDCTSRGLWLLCKSHSVGQKGVPRSLSGSGCPGSHGQYHYGLILVRIPLCSFVEAPVSVQPQ